MDRKFYEYALKKVREGDEEYLEKLLMNLSRILKFSISVNMTYALKSTKSLPMTLRS